MLCNSDLIQFNLGPIAITNKNGTKKGIINLLKKGGPTDIFSEDITSRNTGYTVPIKITERKYIINQLLIKIDVSLLNQKKLTESLDLTLWKKKKINSDKKIKKNKKININNPLSGSFAKVWMEFKIPDLTKKVPHMLKVNVDIDKITTQEVKVNLFSKTKMQWRSVVKANHGIKETFSTGSQNQKPPQPSS